MSEALGKRSRAGRPRGSYKKGSRLGFGPRAWDSMRLYYQLGGATADQDARFLGRHRQVSYQTLSSLFSQRLIDKAPVQTNGRPKDFCYLAKRDGGQAITMGAHRAGVDDERASRSQYKLFQLPAIAEHHYLRNEFYLALRAAASLFRDVEIPLWRMWGESHSDFPYRGEARPAAGGRSGDAYEEIRPDGLFEIRWPQFSGTFLLELETQTRRAKVLEKIDAYAGRWLRMQKEAEKAGIGPLAFEGFHPVVFVFQSERTAVSRREMVREAVSEDSKELSRYLKLWERVGGRVPPGVFFLFAGLGRFRNGDDGQGTGGGALGASYTPLSPYPEKLGGEWVDPRTVARATRSLREA